METVTLSLPEAYALAMRALSANGFSEDHAAAVARNVTGGERDGCASHGLWRLLGIVDTLRKGKVSRMPNRRLTIGRRGLCACRRRVFAAGV